MTDWSSTSSEPRHLPAGRAVGRISPPPSKSQTQRFYNLALLAPGPTLVESPLRAGDCERFLAGLAGLGAGIDRLLQGVRVTPGALPPEAWIDCGDDGTMLRFLTAGLAALPGRWSLDGSARLRQRPLAGEVDALQSLGASVRYLGAVGGAPVEVLGGTLRGGSAGVDASASSQFLSALLMACLRAPRRTVLRPVGLISRPYVDLTLEAIHSFGGAVERVGDAYVVEPGLSGATRVQVEADYSAACYLAAAAAMSGGRVELEGLRPGSLQGDRRFFDILDGMGALVSWSSGRLVVAGGGALRPVHQDCRDIPDQVPTLAVLALFARGVSVLREVPHARLKESDRLEVMARELTRLGGRVEELPDGLIIHGEGPGGPAGGEGIVLDPHGDHRIAMSLALVGVVSPGLAIADPGVVGKSYPGFWDDLERLIAGG